MGIDEAQERGEKMIEVIFLVENPYFFFAGAFKHWISARTWQRVEYHNSSIITFRLGMHNMECKHHKKRNPYMYIL